MKKQILFATTLSLILFGCGQDTGTDQVGNDSIPSIVKPVSKDPIIEKLSAQLRNDISNAALYNQRAKRYAEIGDLVFAEQDVLRALNLDSKNCEYSVTYSSLFLMKNQLDAAEEVLQNLLRVNTNCPEVFIGLGDVYLYRRDNEASIKYLDEALKLDVHNAMAYYKKGINFLELKDTATAISSIQTAVEQDPEFYDGFVQLGLLMAQKGDPLAEQYYQTALRLDTNSLEVMYNLGMHYQESDKFNEAIKTYTKITEKNPNIKEAFFNLGYVHMVLLEVYQPAIPYFTKAIALDPDNYYQAYYNRGYCFELLGDIGNAEKDYSKALEINPGYTLAAQGLGRVRGELDPNNQPINK